jgi:hypothetical protein
MAETTQVIKELKNLIAKNKLKKAIDQLRELLEHTPLLRQAILQERRFHDLQQKIMMNTISEEEANLQKNQLSLSLIQLLDAIKHQQTNIPAIAEEIEKASIHIENSKNIVTGNITTQSGNVQIGDSTTITESKTSKNLRLFLFLFVPLLAISLGVLYYQYRLAQEPLLLTVAIKNQTPNPNLPLENAKVQIRYGGTPDVKDVTNNEAIFRGIPSKFRKEPINLTFSALGFVPIDTQFVLDKEHINLPIQRDDTYARIFGTVKDVDTGELLQGVKVSVQDISAITDALGYYEMEIPFEKQRKKQNIKASFKGYKEYLRNGEPIEKTEPTNILLRKTTK